MKRLLVAALVLLSLPATSLAICNNDLVVLTAEAGEWTCYGDMAIAQPLTVYVDVHLNGHHDPVTELGFRIEGLPEGLEGGICNFVPLAGQVSGDPETGLVFAFDPPLEPSEEPLTVGYIDLIAIDPSWPGDDVEFHVDEPFVHDIYGQDFYVARGFFTVNHTGPGEPWCQLAGDFELYHVEAHSLTPAPGAEVGDEFSFGFDVDAWNCMLIEPWPFTAEVFVGGDLAHVFAGEGSQHFDCALDASGFEAGSAVPVDLHVTAQYGDAHCHVEYLAGETTPAAAATFTAVKARY
jgi:hypothetical protein